MNENERVRNAGNIDSEVTRTPVVSESAIGEITLSVLTSEKNWRRPLSVLEAPTRPTPEHDITLQSQLGWK
jgi:hypothetical protein